MRNSSIGSASALPIIRKVWCTSDLCVVGYSTLHGQYEVSGRSSKNSDLSVEQFSVWVKHYYAVSFLSSGSYSAQYCILLTFFLLTRPFAILYCAEAAVPREYRIRSNLEPGPSALENGCLVTEADRAWGHLKITSQFLASYFWHNNT